jgi:hypothetical protein
VQGDLRRDHAARTPLTPSQEYLRKIPDRPEVRGGAFQAR